MVKTSNSATPVSKGGHSSVSDLEREIALHKFLFCLRSIRRVVADSRANDSPSHSRFHDHHAPMATTMGLPFSVIAVHRATFAYELFCSSVRQVHQRQLNATIGYTVFKIW
ncbi:hypothetical protein TNCT_461761 [Trichonephila clavata]|uniref:Uncharacterized protein n=1 Tax=Trichonephila clavata TaxID=2740835 RepID=A0A8X6L3I0_TRICU|nr:hypothetical protein TNCT_461761 [Trichonephila clavata]